MAIPVALRGDFKASQLRGLARKTKAGSDSRTLYGFTIDAGAAYALSKNWDIGAEYRYSQYSGQNFDLGSVAAVCGFVPGIAVTVGCFNTTATGHKDLTTNEVLFKLNYRFNSGPVVAKY
jgi:opacity protein-like surface antigen